MPLPRRLALLAGLAVAALLIGIWLAKGNIGASGTALEGTTKETAKNLDPDQEWLMRDWIEKTKAAYAKAQEYLQRGELDKARIVAMRGVHYPHKWALAAIKEEIEPPLPVSLEGPSSTEIIAYFPENEALRFFYIPADANAQIFYFEPIPGQDRFGVKWAGVTERCEPYLVDSSDTFTRYLAASGRKIVREVGQRPPISGSLTGYCDPPFSFDTLKVTIPANPKPTDGYKIWKDFFTPRALKIEGTYKHLPDGRIVPAF